MLSDYEKTTNKSMAVHCVDQLHCMFVLFESSFYLFILRGGIAES